MLTSNRSVRGAVVVAGLFAALLVPTMAFATVYTYMPGGGCSANPAPDPANCSAPSGDLGDLDHHYVYAWRITGPTLTPSNQVLSATLTFSNMYNWDNNTNTLFIDLLDTALSAGSPSNSGTTGTVTNLNGGLTSSCDGATPANNCVTRFADNPLDNSFCDAFSPGSGNQTSAGCPSFSSSAGWLITPTTAHYFMTDQQFAGPPTAGGQVDQTPDCIPGQPNTPGGCMSSGWTATMTTASGVNFFTYTYTFNGTDLGNLNSVLADGVFALGLDPDCHFYNDGITLTLNTGTPSAVPEPASLTLLGTGIAALVGRAVRRRRARVAV